MPNILTLPDHPAQTPSIRAKALVFEDAASQALLAHAEQVAASDASVLIMGETGTGKELIARHVHACSGRRGPFVAVNCGAFSDTLVEAELFGHEAGSYTGAQHARAGWFEAAQQGTLFLDEVGDLPLSMQVKLLRVLQERQVVRLGSRKAIDVDVRLVAATNVDLEAAVEAGRFRRDLFYRLNIATLHLPPLAQRPADIMALAQHFLALYAKKLRSGPLHLTLEARSALLSHAWPGNIRELENVIHHAVITTPGHEITAQALRLRPSLRQASPTVDAPAATASISSNASTATRRDVAPGTEGAFQLWQQCVQALFEARTPELFDRLEHDLVHAAYQRCQGNQVHTAALLGLSRHVLRTHLRRHGLLPGGQEQAAGADDAPATAPSLGSEGLSAA